MCSVREREALDVGAFRNGEGDAQEDLPGVQTGALQEPL